MIAAWTHTHITIFVASSKSEKKAAVQMFFRAKTFYKYLPFDLKREIHAHRVISRHFLLRKNQSKTIGITCW